MKCLNCESDSLKEEQEGTFKCLECGRFITVMVLRLAAPSPSAFDKSTDAIADSTQKGQNVVNNGRTYSLGRLPVSLWINGSLYTRA